MATSPYLKENRLADVIAAVTAMGIYRHYKLSFEDWAERIANKPSDARKWGELFAQHSEFFRIDEKKQVASLVWRRQLLKNFDANVSKELNKLEFLKLDNAARAQLSRRPLSPSEVTSLISIAVNLHDRALEQTKAKDWWKAVLLAGGLSFFGAALGAWLS